MIYKNHILHRSVKNGLPAVLGFFSAILIWVILAGGYEAST